MKKQNLSNEHQKLVTNSNRTKQLAKQVIEKYENDIKLLNDVERTQKAELKEKAAEYENLSKQYEQTIAGLKEDLEKMRRESVPKGKGKGPPLGLDFMKALKERKTQMNKVEKEVLDKPKPEVLSANDVLKAQIREKVLKRRRQIEGNIVEWDSDDHREVDAIKMYRAKELIIAAAREIEEKGTFNGKIWSRGTGQLEKRYPALQLVEDILKTGPISRDILFTMEGGQGGMSRGGGMEKLRDWVLKIAPREFKDLMVYDLENEGIQYRNLKQRIDNKDPDIKDKDKLRLQLLSNGKPPNYENEIKKLAYQRKKEKQKLEAKNTSDQKDQDGTRVLRGVSVLSVESDVSGGVNDVVVTIFFDPVDPSRLFVRVQE